MFTILPRIYVACLAAYNNGYLHGAWIDATQDAESIEKEIHAMLAASPIPNAEEHAIHDYEGFDSIHLDEYESIKTVVETVAFLEEYGELGAALKSRFPSSDIEEVKKIMEECYLGKYDSEEDYACTLAEETMEIPEHLAYYIDYEALAHDIFINDCFSIEAGGKIHVFSHY